MLKIIVIWSAGKKYDFEDVICYTYLNQNMYFCTKYDITQIFITPASVEYHYTSMVVEVCLVFKTVIQINNFYFTYKSNITYTTVANYCWIFFTLHQYILVSGNKIQFAVAIYSTRTGDKLLFQPSKLSDSLRHPKSLLKYQLTLINMLLLLATCESI